MNASVNRSGVWSWPRRYDTHLGCRVSGRVWAVDSGLGDGVGKVVKESVTLSCRRPYIDSDHRPRKRKT
jgi:hypothetical protein